MTTRSIYSLARAILIELSFGSGYSRQVEERATSWCSQFRQALKFKITVSKRVHELAFGVVIYTIETMA